LKVNLPNLKESGPLVALLTHIAKKSKGAQGASIFYASSWVLARGCPFSQPPDTANTNTGHSIT
ncbi:uncharacterized, partial [Tachysurus ichikawai]